MNFLAHAYLSFHHPEILVGNMISDFVKGSSKFNYGITIQKGIMLHREIDQFTDVHPATHEAMQFFKPYYRLYSSPIMDILYDHFLANDETIFKDDSSLKIFTREIYSHLETYSTQLPEKFVYVFTYMRMEDWLYNYRLKQGIEKSLRGLIRRAAFISDSDTAINLFLENYDHLDQCYKKFFPDVKQFAKQKLDELVL